MCRLHYRWDINDYVSQVKSLNEDAEMNGAHLRNAVLNKLLEDICLRISLFGQPIEDEGFIDFVEMAGKKYKSFLRQEKELMRQN